MKYFRSFVAVAFAAALSLTAFGAPPEVRVVYRPVDHIIYQPVRSVIVQTNTIERVVTNTVEKPVEVVVERFISTKGAPPRVETVYVDRPVEKVVTNTVEVVVEKEKVVEKPVEVIVEKEVTNTVEVVVEKPVTNMVEVVVEKEKVVEKPVEVIVEKEVTNTVERIVEKEKIVEKPVEVVVQKVVTNVVEKAVHDFAEEERLRGEGKAATDRGDALEAKNTLLVDDNERLRKELSDVRAKCQRLERLVPKDQVPSVKGTRQAQITSKSTYYDRKEGYAVFDGNVHVDDERYQLHTDKAYVFMDGTNNLRRLVAMGGVALTNEAKRAYGTKASYYRQSGMVILYGDEKRPAEVRDESKFDDQVVIGRKIKFWIDQEQVEVLDANISAPVTEGALPITPQL